MTPTPLPPPIDELYKGETAYIDKDGKITTKDKAYMVKTTKGGKIIFAFVAEESEKPK